MDELFLARYQHEKMTTLVERIAFVHQTSTYEVSTCRRTSEKISRLRARI